MAKVKEFYERAGQYAKSKGLTINIVTIIVTIIAITIAITIVIIIAVVVAVVDADVDADVDVAEDVVVDINSLSVAKHIRSKIILSDLIESPKVIW